MEITQLHYFKIVAKYESFTRAAQELHITQSALSRSISQLEEDIGIRLFQRKKGGKITLNRDGVFFLRHVVQVLNTLENTVTAVKEMAGMEKGVINMAVSEFVFLKNVMYDFLMDYPQVRLNCRLQSEQQMQESLEDGTINFAICRKALAGEDFSWQPLYQDRMTVLLPPGHPLSQRKSLHLDELRNENFIVSNVGFNMASGIQELCQLAGFSPYIIYEGAGEDLCGWLVASGLGVMLTPFSITQGLQDSHSGELAPMAAVPLVDDFAATQVGAVMKWGQFQSDAALNLFERIVDFYQGLPQVELG